MRSSTAIARVVFGKRFDKAPGIEWPIKPHFEQTDFFLSSFEKIDRLMRRFAAGTHQHDHAFGVGRAVILKGLISPSGQLREFVHRLLHDFRTGGVEWIHRFARLKINVRILRRAADYRMIGREGARAMLEDTRFVDHRAQDLDRQHFDLRDFVRGAEAVEEMQKRNARLERGGVCNQREILRFLHRSRAEHRPTGRPRRHDIAVIAKDGKRLRGERTRRDVKNRRSQFARDLVHVRDHQEQSLRSGERCAERAGLQRAMDRPGGAAFALHLDDGGHRAPQVLHPACCPGVGPFAHRRGRCDRVNGDDFVQRVGNARDGFVGVDRLAVGLETAISCNRSRLVPKVGIGTLRHVTAVG